MHEFEDLLTLGQAAKISPGRPSTNCLWRWCRRGVRSRLGARVYLQHLRVGGKVYTCAEWLADFGRALADADTEYFRAQQEDKAPLARSEPKRRRQRLVQHRRESIEQASRELKEAGL